MPAVESSKKFIGEVVLETKKKVTWPTWAELRESTTVVLIAVLIISAFVYAVDLVIGRIVQAVL